MNRLLVFFILILPIYLYGQAGGGVHYTVRDGLPSSTVYCTAQDQLGYMWIATEAGLVRFDGTNFKVYTRRDGLPDNEVLGLHFDNITKRLWIVTYSKAACYYRNGVIYTVKNDSSLVQIANDVTAYIDAYSQSGLGVFLYNGNTLYKCAGDRINIVRSNIVRLLSAHQDNDSTIDVLETALGVKRYTSHTPFPQDVLLDTVFSRGIWMGHRFFLYKKGEVIVYDHKAGEYRFERSILFDKNAYVVSMVRRSNKYIMSIANEGIYEYDTSGLYPTRQIWRGNSNGISVDKDDNLWISTRDDGVYILKHNEVRNYYVNNVTSIFRNYEGVFYWGDNKGVVYSLRNGAVETIAKGNGGTSDVIRGFTGYGDKILYLSDVVNVYNLRDKSIKKNIYTSGGPKSILKLRDGHTILIGFSYSMIEHDYIKDRDKEVVTAKRAITMAQHPDGRIFCGSLDGLYTYSADSMTKVIVKDTRMQERVTALFITPDSLVWIGTPSSGILVSDGRRVLRDINQFDDRSYHGTICRRIVSSKPGEVWVATNDGVNLIKYHRADSLVIDNITPIDSRDGLLSNDAYDIQVEDSIVAIATSAGVTLLDIRLLKAPAEIPLYISSIRINERDSAIHDEIYCLDYRQNSIAIEYIGVSLPVGVLSYQYRLLGSDNDDWTSTSNTSIDFRSLSPGDYTFEVAVLDKFGNKSQSIGRVRFKISPAFYMTFWFWGLVMVSILTIGFYIIRTRFQRQQQRFEKEQGLNNKIIELEQQALKAQMNPHFIFNCLTAIQHFVNREDMYAANMYLSNFAKLIRKTLDLSGEQYISLDKEVSYLENYIQLEKLRFQEKFQYTVTVAPDIDEYTVLLPPMLLQPIIENAIRHGLRNMDDDAGVLSVAFAMEGGRLIATIDDNGVGRKKAKEMKTTAHIEYQSKGMSLTMSRIQAINMISAQKITIEIKDKYNDNNESEGTLFILTFEQDENT